MSDTTTLKILIVDDTLFYRKILCDIINDIPGVKTVGTASNGKIALSRISTLKPHLVIMDINMPEMDGIETLKYIKRDTPEMSVILISAHTQKDSKVTMKALEMGAFDFIPKPESDSMDKSAELIKKSLLPMIKAFARRKEIREILHKPRPIMPIIDKPQSDSIDIIQRMRRISTGQRLKPLAVSIGISTGGPNALAQVIPKLPKTLNVPVLIVQHMPPVFTQALAQSLDSKSELHVIEAADQSIIEPNVVYIAPGGKQMRIECRSGEKKMIRITDDPPENNCKPSADYLFRSVAECFGERAMGVIMTGMGSDGFLGLKIMKENGAYIIAQDEKSCVVFGMPREPIESGITDVISHLDHIADEIVKIIV